MCAGALIDKANTLRRRRYLLLAATTAMKEASCRDTKSVFSARIYARTIQVQ
jgi:hypothetical protein